VLEIVYNGLKKRYIYKGACLIEDMFEWLFGTKYKELEMKSQEGFYAVKKDMETAGKWIKHLDSQDKRLFDVLAEMKRELSTVKDELASLREGVDLAVGGAHYEQVLGKSLVGSKQTGVFGGEKGVQTGVQTGNFYEILKQFTGNERLLIMTLAQSDMKLSYEDLALLLGKERATIRGQVNSIKQKSEGLLCELSEKNGKKRVFVPEEVRNKLAKYAKVRVKGHEKRGKKNEKPVLFEENNTSEGL
jgi:biotin operon repressor